MRLFHSQIGRDSVWRVLRWFFFQWDAERAHLFTLFMIRWVDRLIGHSPLRFVSGTQKEEERPEERQEFFQAFGMEFHSRVGLAAGFDKNGEILTALPALGFGFAEIGTVTPRPQPGNPCPRLFRDPQRRALFNRMGFNSWGAQQVSHEIALRRGLLPKNFRVGINLGKNKDTPLEEAWRDYVSAARYFEGLADYLVVNISSPNTPGLRSLQTVETIRPILMALQDLISGWKRRLPLLVKLAPELCGEKLTDLVAQVDLWGVNGWVLTNTLGGQLNHQGRVLDGGWSGGPLSVSAQKSLYEVRQVTHHPIVSVGGILSCEEGVKRILGGADLLQIYTGWIYQGPQFPARLNRRICELPNRCPGVSQDALIS